MDQLQVGSYSFIYVMGQPATELYCKLCVIYFWNLFVLVHSRMLLEYQHNCVELSVVYQYGIMGILYDFLILTTYIFVTYAA